MGAGGEAEETRRGGVVLFSAPTPTLPHFRGGGGLDDLRVPVEDFPQVCGWLYPVFFHDLEQAQDVAHSRERHSFLARQVLDHLHLADVALRVAAPIGARAMGLDQVRVLVQHQGAGVRLQDLCGDADRVERLVEVAERRLCAAWRSSAHRG